MQPKAVSSFSKFDQSNDPFSDAAFDNFFEEIKAPTKTQTGPMILGQNKPATNSFNSAIGSSNTFGSGPVVGGFGTFQ